MTMPDPRNGVALRFDTFGWGELRAEARATGCSESELVQRAVRHYVAALDRPGEERRNRVPRFVREPLGEDAPRLEVELAPELVERLHDEADAQQTSVPLLIRHAVFIELSGPSGD